MTTPRFSVVILAGGQSRRMGRDKRGLPWIPTPGGSPQTLLGHVVATVSRLTDDVVLVANDDPSVPGARVVGDLYSRSGSLGGIYSGLAAVAHDLAFVAAADMPFLNPLLVLDLVRQASRVDAVVPVTGGRPEPLHAVYRKTVLAPARRQIERRELKIALLFDAVSTVGVPEADLRRLDPDLRSFWNLNTPEEYQRALALAGGRRSGVA
ncbi:MAG: molybdenum cofactor guanylyltransferase [Chloroflexota bacterium]|nr:molybdenum cofactor guanylyltransferase [Chloroflexota bacterium]